MRADLVLLDADPLADVANFNRRAGVMVRGNWVPEASLQVMLEEMATSYAAPGDAFAELQALPREGEQLYTGRFRMKYGDRTMSEERFAVEELNNVLGMKIETPGGTASFEKVE